MATKTKKKATVKRTDSDFRMVEISFRVPLDKRITCKSVKRHMKAQKFGIMYNLIPWDGDDRALCMICGLPQGIDVTDVGER